MDKLTDGAANLGGKILMVVLGIPLIFVFVYMAVFLYNVGSMLLSKV